MRSPCARQCDRLVSSSLIGARDIRVKVVGHFVDMRLPNTELPKLIEASYELVITERRVELGLALPLSACVASVLPSRLLYTRVRTRPECLDRARSAAHRAD
jgi:hypothetical protein